MYIHFPHVAKPKPFSTRKKLKINTNFLPYQNQHYRFYFNNEENILKHRFIIDLERVIDASDRGEDFLETARVLGVKPTTAHSIVRRRRISTNREGARKTKMVVEVIRKSLGILKKPTSLQKKI